MMAPEEALGHWRHRATIQPAPDAGLINRTWEVGNPSWAILQWVNPIFDPQIHLDIDAVTRRLEACGLLTPLLVPAADGSLWVSDDSGCWRLMTYIAGQTLHRLHDPALAAEAGALVGRFHAALADWSYDFRAAPRPIHDTPARMAELGDALESAAGHPLAEPAGELGRTVLEEWARWDGELVQPSRPCHGDLKISNLRFDPAGRRALCLIDLDTLAPMPLVCEMGDAWRSWCNPAGEDDPERASFDQTLFAASARAWLAHAPPLEAHERRALVPGIERICLELTARFCADALRNSYFREDRRRYPEPGTHNLERARGQLTLARSARACRKACEAVLQSACAP
ncbi:MAG: aminoglycoside phosphotransferase family protein [bacterium]|nr:aminoglycoside phosphotransferase family protein [bacterium]